MKNERQHDRSKPDRDKRNNHEIKKEREFEQATVTVRLLLFRVNHKRENIRGHYTECMRSSEETGQRTK